MSQIDLTNHHDVAQAVRKHLLELGGCPETLAKVLLEPEEWADVSPPIKAFSSELYEGVSELEFDDFGFR